jgi:outer membrane scaffolding protein for murein synthesis (MipA/OmpV family)
MKNGRLWVLGLALLPIGAAWSGEADADRLLMVGAGAATMPDYPGGRQMRGELLPFIQARHGRFSFDGGPRFDLLSEEAGSVSVGLSYDPGRRDSRPRYAGTPGSDYLRGMGRIDGAPTLDVKAARRFGGLELSGQIARWASRNDFVTAAFGAQFELPVGEWSVTLAGYADWGNAKFMQSFYGVTAAQSGSSGFAVYTPGAQLHSVRGLVQVAHPLSPRWLVIAMASNQHLLGKASSSPVVQRRDGASAMLTLAYRFH